MIPFNKPYLTGNETKYIEDAVKLGKISGNGFYTNKCHEFFKSTYRFKKVLLTTSCTHALEMAAILLDIKENDEVIMPSFTFVSTANAFVLRGARIVFADCYVDIPNIDADKIENLITEKTKAIVAVHYAGIACDMEKIMNLAQKYKLAVVEDAAQAIGSFYKNRPLGGIADLGSMSFHETKNIISGEGGMLIINNEKYFKRAEIIWEKGTNRTAFFRGEVDKYGWVDIGGSFLPSEITAAFLWAQLENLKKITDRRNLLWNQYYKLLKPLENKGIIKLPTIPSYTTSNAHIFYIICRDLETRTKLIEFLRINGILAVFHYLSLHKSPFYKNKHDGRQLPNSDYFSDCLVRLPLFFELTLEQVSFITGKIVEFFNCSGKV